MRYLFFLTCQNLLSFQILLALYYNKAFGILAYTLTCNVVHHLVVTDRSYHIGHANALVGIFAIYYAYLLVCVEVERPGVRVQRNFAGLPYGTKNMVSWWNS